MPLSISLTPWRLAAFLIFNQTPESVLNLRKPERFYATQGELEDLMADYRQVLEALDYQDTQWNDLLTRTLRNLSRLFKKAGLERREFHMFKAFLSRVEQAILARHCESASNVGAGFIPPSEGAINCAPTSVCLPRPPTSHRCDWATLGFGRARNDE